MTNSKSSNGNDKPAFHKPAFHFVLFEYFKNNSYYFLYAISGILLAIALSDETKIGPLNIKSSAEGAERWVLIGIALIFLFSGLALHLNLFGLQNRSNQSTSPSSSNEAEVKLALDMRNNNLQESFSKSTPVFSQVGIDIGPAQAALQDYQEAQSRAKLIVAWMKARQTRWLQDTTNAMYRDYPHDTRNIQEIELYKDLETLCQILEKNILELKSFAPKERNFTMPEDREFLYTQAMEKFKSIVVEELSPDFPSSDVNLFERYANVLITDLSG
ncbi:MAG: hypothetical protein F6K19_43620 [Cyanothece sp. SIO1E1]|nr:hypothetical protein [Cyanothece sp. SIO1E1]